MKEKRQYMRYDVWEQDIYVNIIDKEGASHIGKIRDISRGGVSFYSYKDITIDDDEDEKIVTVSFKINGEKIVFETLIIRTQETYYGVLHAGMFTGIPSHLRRILFQLSKAQEAHELVLA